MWVNKSLCEIRKNGFPSTPALYFKHHGCDCDQTKRQGYLSNLKDSFKVVFTDKVELDIFFYFLP